MTVTVNAGRGGVVLEDASTVVPTLPGPTEVVCEGEPEGCTTCLCDFDGNGIVTWDELTTFIGVMAANDYGDIPESDPAYLPCGDPDSSGAMTWDDLTSAIGWLASNDYGDTPCP